MLVSCTYQAVVVGEGLGSEDVGELLHQHSFPVQELQVGHGVLPQVVCPEPIEGHQQQWRRRRPRFLLPIGRSHGNRHDAAQEDWQ